MILNGTISNNERKTTSYELNSDEDEPLSSTTSNCFISLIIIDYFQFYVLETRSYESNKRLHNAEQHRLNANTALQLNNYQQSIDLYTKSILLEPNLLAYVNRAIACMFHFEFDHLFTVVNLDYKLDNIDPSISDCSHVLTIDPKNTTGLFIV